MKFLVKNARIMRADAHTRCQTLRKCHGGSNRLDKVAKDQLNFASTKTD